MTHFTPRFEQQILPNIEEAKALKYDNNIKARPPTLLVLLCVFPHSPRSPPLLLSMANLMASPESHMRGSEEVVSNTSAEERKVLHYQVIGRSFRNSFITIIVLCFLSALPLTIPAEESEYGVPELDEWVYYAGFWSCLTLTVTGFVLFLVACLPNDLGIPDAGGWEMALRYVLPNNLIGFSVFWIGVPMLMKTLGVVERARYSLIDYVMAVLGMLIATIPHVIIRSKIAGTGGWRDSMRSLIAIVRDPQEKQKLSAIKFAVMIISPQLGMIFTMALYPIFIIPLYRSDMFSDAGRLLFSTIFHPVLIEIQTMFNRLVSIGRQQTWGRFPEDGSHVYFLMEMVMTLNRR